MVRPEIAGPQPREAKTRNSICEGYRQLVRKGNILEIDDKLYVVLNAESFHPGKGTPTTQIDMRRISDGVKISQRYKTTEQVERAHVEDREFQFLYSDGEGFHFMNSENYDQITLPEDLIGDAGGLSAAGDEGHAQRARGQSRWRSSCRRRSSLEVVETEPVTKGQTASSSYKPAMLSNGVRTKVPPHHRRRHPHRGDDRRRLLRRAREGLTIRRRILHRSSCPGELSSEPWHRPGRAEIALRTCSSSP